MKLLLFGLALFVSSVTLAADSHGFHYRNPVRPGDYPDPSVIRVGDDYWATATSSEWAPHFPLLHSRDLVNWEAKGYVFSEMPAWAKGNFWAPEIAHHRGKFFIYYTARESASNRLAVAVATADHPSGPWKDHGPMIAQEAGSIDAVPFTDAQGVRWLIWKEDGNSRKLPTPLWISRLSEDGTKFAGEKKEILRNDVPWEGAVVEGPFVVRRGDYYYLFYAGGACCGRSCNYAVGVARASDMLGPWQKAPTNPIMAGNETWRCPGHGSIVSDKDGRHWFLYHAYAQNGFVATGRQMLLDEIVFGGDGWPVINRGKGATSQALAPALARSQKDVRAFREDFDRTGELGPGWQWVLGRKPMARISNGMLRLTTSDTDPASALQSITVPSFVAETAVNAGTLTDGAFAGLVAYGDRVNHLAFVTNGRSVQVWSVRRGERTVVGETAVPAGAATRLRITCAGGSAFRFEVQASDGGWTKIIGETDGSFLPPWDRGVRTGMYVAGPKGTTASFDYFASVPDATNVFTR